jgi:dienelactone hydrolase
MRAGWLACLWLLAGCAAPAVVSRPVAEAPLLNIPVPGTGQSIAARLCRPALAGPVPLAVINHGSPARASARPGMRPAACSAEAVRWFTERGFAVLLPLRRGYGAAGGRWAEGFGACDAPDYLQAGRESSLDIAAAIEHARRLPGIRPEGVLVVGQSAGGWGALALAEDRPAAVAAVVNMAGGRGGWARGQPGQVCASDRLVAAAGEYGRAAILPTLWIYTGNDSFFGPDLAAAMHRAFTGAGGRAELRVLPAFGSDGHALLFGAGGSAAWGPPVEAFLRAQGFTTRAP